MEIIGIDAGEDIDVGSMVVFKMTGNYKAPVPNDIKLVLVNAKRLD